LSPDANHFAVDFLLQRIYILARMAEIELELRDLSVPELIALGSRLANGLANNENFPNPEPPIDQLNGILQEMKEKQEEYRQRRLQLSEFKMGRDAMVKRLKTALSTGVNYVQKASGGDSKKIISANLPFEHGIDLWPFNDPKQVTELSASAGDHPGEIDLVWDPVRGADGYEIEISRDLGWPEKWSSCAASARSKTTLEQLDSRQRYWFRVRAVSEKGVGTWSDPVTKFAP